MFDLRGPAGVVNDMLDEGKFKDALQQGHEARLEQSVYPVIARCVVSWKQGGWRDQRRH